MRISDQNENHVLVVANNHVLVVANNRAAEPRQHASAPLSRYVPAGSQACLWRWSTRKAPWANA